MQVLTDQQKMLALAFFADTDLNQSGGSKCADALVAYNGIVQKLGVLNAKVGDDWKVVWGPAVYSFLPSNDDKERRFDNLIYVAQNGETNQYVAAIAGTNGRALWDWLIEDTSVHETVPWTLGNSGSAGRISMATHTGLSVLLQIAPCPGLPGEGQDLMAFLASVAGGEDMTVSTTGHSLGGALSPALALALVDERGTWDPSGRATVAPYAFAGATPGDAAFAAYFLSRFPNFVRVWNTLDMVPHAWEVAQLEEIPTLYGPKVVDVEIAVDILVARVVDIGYTQLGEGTTFSGPAPTPAPTGLKEFLAEALTQHISAYMDWATIQDWPCWPPTES